MTPFAPVGLSLLDKAFPEIERLLAGAGGVVVAVSGGPDSMALMGLLKQWRDTTERPVPIAVATVNHGLRPEAADEARLVATAAASLGFAHANLVWSAHKPTTGLQEAARNARYGLLCEHAVALKLTHLVTAHHADDQAETVLMRLIAGSGIGGLGGMRDSIVRAKIQHVRPLLAIEKSELVSWCVTNAMPFVDDASNTNLAFGRARARRVMGLLAHEGLTRERLVTLAARAQRAEDSLYHVAKATFNNAVRSTSNVMTELDWQQVAAQPADIRTRVMALAILSITGSDQPIKLEGLERLMSGIDQAAVDGRPLRRTIAGCIIALGANLALTVAHAPPRKHAQKRPVSSVRSG